MFKILDIKHFLFFIYLLTIFDIFTLTPLSVLANIFLFLFSVYGLYLFFIKKMYKNKFFKYIFIVINLLFFLGVISSFLFLKQDIYSGILASIRVFNSFSIFVYLLWIQNQDINIDKVFRKLFNFIWIYLIFLIIASVLGLTFVFISPISGNELVTDASKIGKNIFWFGECYFLVKYVLKNNSLYLFKFLLIFIGTQIQDIQRGDILVLAVTIFFILFKFSDKKSVKKMYLLAPIFTFFLLILFSGSNLSKTVNEKFNQIFMLLDQSKVPKIDDPSVFIRLEEIDFAVSKFVESPIFGNGLIRTSKKEQLIGDIYFYPDDIGIIGILFSFGFMGIIIYIYIAKKLFKISIRDNSILYTGLYVYLFYILIYTLKNGTILYNPARYLFFLSLLTLYQKTKFNFLRK